MTILFLVKFYQPFDRGGSEWSTRDLAKLLKEKGHEVTILTPNYGSVSQELVEGINLRRIPFPIKLASPKSQIAPFWTNNLIWFLYSSIYIIYFFLKHNFDIIHVHSNEFLPAAYAAKIFLRKPTVATFRDYQSLCSLGFCLWEKKHACNLASFIKDEYPFFYKNYVQNKNIINYVVLFAAAIRAQALQKIIYTFAKRVDSKVAVSQKVADIFKHNGIKDIKVIHNPVLVEYKVSPKSSNQITYVGKFSKGKGAELLPQLLLSLSKSLKEAKYKLIGSGYLEKKIKSFITRNKLSSKVKITGQLSHKRTLAEINKSALVIVPSLWQEPLPRSVIETLENGVPVVATKVGGIPEIVADGKYGILTSTDTESFKKAVIRCYEDKNRFKNNIIQDLEKIKDRFSKKVVKRYLKVYQNLLI